MIATITISGATPRQLYDMTYRLIDTPATVHTRYGQTHKGKLMGGTWRLTRRSSGHLAESLSFTTDAGLPLTIPFSLISGIELNS